MSDYKIFYTQNIYGYILVKTSNRTLYIPVYDEV